MAAVLGVHTHSGPRPLQHAAGVASMVRKAATFMCQTETRDTRAHCRRQRVSAFCGRKPIEMPGAPTDHPAGGRDEAAAALVAALMERQGKMNVCCFHVVSAQRTRSLCL